MKASLKHAGGIVVYGLNQRSIKRFRTFFQLFIYSINASVAIFTKAFRWFNYSQEIIKYDLLLWLKNVFNMSVLPILISRKKTAVWS